MKAMRFGKWVLVLVAVSILLLAGREIVFASLATPWYEGGQYQGQREENNDCGTFCAATIAEAYGKRPSGIEIVDWMIKVREYSGRTLGWLFFEDMERAFDNPNINLGHRRVLRPRDNPDPTLLAEMDEIIGALRDGYPVVALINPKEAAGFGRSYVGHWVVLKSYDADSRTFMVNDPDWRAVYPTPGWLPGGENQQWPFGLLKRGIKASGQDCAIIVGSPLELSGDTAASRFVDTQTVEFFVSFKVRNPNPVLSIQPRAWFVGFADPTGDGGHFYSPREYVTRCDNCYREIPPGGESLVSITIANVQDVWRMEDHSMNGSWTIGPMHYCGNDNTLETCNPYQDEDVANPRGLRERVCVNVCCFGTGAQGAGKEASLLGCPNYCGSNPTSTPIPTEGPRPTATLTPDRREVILLDPTDGAWVWCSGQMVFRWMGSVAWYKLEVKNEQGEEVFSSGWTRNTSCQAPTFEGNHTWKVYGGHTEGDFRYQSETFHFRVHGCTPTPRPRSPTSTKTVTRTLTKTPTPSPTRTVTRTSTRRPTPTSVRPSATYTKTATVTKTPTVTRTLSPTRTSTPIAGPKVRVKVKAIDKDGRGLPDFYFRAWYSVDTRFNHQSDKFKTDETGWAEIYLPGERLNITVGPEGPFPGTFCQSGKVSFEPKIRQGWNQTYFQTHFTFSCEYKIYLPKILTSPPLR